MRLDPVHACAGEEVETERVGLHRFINREEISEELFLLELECGGWIRYRDAIADFRVVHIGKEAPAVAPDFERAHECHVEVLEDVIKREIERCGEAADADIAVEGLGPAVESAADFP